MKKTQSIFSEGFRTKKETVPRYLYKYFPNGINALKVIQDERIHLETPDTYNDIFDSAITITIDHLDLLSVPDNIVGAIVRYTHRDCKSNVKSVICDDDFSKCENMKQVANVLITKGISKKVVDNMCQNLVSSLKNVKFSNNLISCFCETNTSELMWAHYGNHLEGVCLCFDTSLDHDLFKHARKIDYSFNRPVVSRGNFNMYFTKSLTWNYEQEWRIVVEREPNDCFISTKSCVGLILGSKLPFENKIRKFVKTEEKNGEMIDTILEEKLPGWCDLTTAAHKNKIKIYKAYPDPYEFKIKIKEWGQDEIQI